MREAREKEPNSEVCLPAVLSCFHTHLHLDIVSVAKMGEKRDDYDERTPLQLPHPRGVRHSASGLAGLFLIFLAAITYGSYFYGVPGHAVKSQAEVILTENPLGKNLGDVPYHFCQHANIICSMFQAPSLLLHG